VVYRNEPLRKGVFVTELQPSTSPIKQSQPKPVEIGLLLPEFVGDEYKGLSLPESRREPYLVDLTDYSCECREWHEWRSGFPVNDVRRACKHIAGVITEEPYADKLSGFARVWCADSIESDEGVPVFETLKAFEVNEVCVVLAKAMGRNWIDVLAYPGYVRRERPYSLYGYDLESNQWCYGQAPEGGAEIEQLIVSNFEPVLNEPADDHSTVNPDLNTKQNKSNLRLVVILCVIGLLAAAALILILGR
jgi:hypothetical protein